MRRINSGLKAYATLNSFQSRAIPIAPPQFFAAHDLRSDEGYKGIEKYLTRGFEGDAVFANVEARLPAIPDKIDPVQTMADVHRKSCRNVCTKAVRFRFGYRSGQSAGHPPMRVLKYCRCDQVPKRRMADYPIDMGADPALFVISL